jgi:hypothetical protein
LHLPSRRKLRCCLTDTFGQPGNGAPASVNGKFSYDTDTMLVSDVSIAGLLETYVSGSVLRGTGFGFADAFFVFTGLNSSFFFDLAELDLDAPVGPAGSVTSFDDVLAFESDDFTSDFVINDGFVLAGTVKVAVAPNPVPVPASLPLLLAGLGGLAWVSRRKAASSAL